MKLLVLNGPNLNLLGAREPEIYGRTSLAEIEEGLRAAFPEAALEFFQSNEEGALIDRLQATRKDGTQGVIFNPGGYTHTSVALRDAISALDAPVVEVHLSNPHARESFRRRFVTAGACRGQIAGLGPRGYYLAVRFFLEEGGSGD